METMSVISGMFTSFTECMCYTSADSERDLSTKLIVVFTIDVMCK